MGRSRQARVCVFSVTPTPIFWRTLTNDPTAQVVPTGRPRWVLVKVLEWALCPKIGQHWGAHKIYCFSSPTTRNGMDRSYSLCTLPSTLVPFSSFLFTASSPLPLSWQTISFLISLTYSLFSLLLPLRSLALPFSVGFGGIFRIKWSVSEEKEWTEINCFLWTSGILSLLGTVFV